MSSYPDPELAAAAEDDEADELPPLPAGFRRLDDELRQLSPSGGRRRPGRLPRRNLRQAA